MNNIVASPHKSQTLRIFLSKYWRLQKIFLFHFETAIRCKWKINVKAEEYRTSSKKYKELFVASNFQFGKFKLWNDKTVLPALIKEIGMN